MRQVPFLMSTLMVQAILAGRKTQTRRIQNPQQDPAGLHTVGVGRPKAQQGDIIWVRENCLWVRLDHAHDLLEGARSRSQWAYQASMQEDWMEYAMEKYGYKWKPSIHMPKAAARIWLRCTDVKVERVQDISQEDAAAEGVGWHPPFSYQAFAQLWQSINGKESWEANPWVWVYSFEVLSTTGKPDNV